MTIRKRLRRRSILAAAVAARFGAPFAAQAQTALPDRPLRIVVGFSAGGGSDVMARLVATALERRIGRRITVENRPGGTGAAAGEALKMIAPDGSMVAFMPSPSLAAKFMSPAYPFDPRTDFAPITTAGTFIDAFAVSPRIGVSSVAEYVAWLKAGDPGRNKLGLTANDAMLQFYVRLVGRAFGVPMEGMAFRGTAALITDMADGKVPASVGGLTSFLVAHRSGRIRILATSGTKRVSVAPDLPTAAEAGYPGLTMEEWYGFFAAAGTPRPLVDAWNRELVTVLNSAEIREQLVQLGLDVGTSTPQEATAKLEAYLNRWRTTLGELGLKTN